MAEFKVPDELEAADGLALDALQLIETVEAMREQVRQMETRADALSSEAHELRGAARELDYEASEIQNDYFEAQRQYESFVLEHGDTIEHLLQEQANKERSASQAQAAARVGWSQDQDWRGVHKGTLEMRDRWSNLDAERNHEAQNKGQSL